MTTIKTFFSQIRFFFQIFEKEHGRPPPSLSLLWLPTMCNRTSRAQVYCFHDYIYITDILLLWDLSTLCVVDHLWPQIYIYIYIKIKDRQIKIGRQIDGLIDRLIDWQFFFFFLIYWWKLDILTCKSLLVECNFKAFCWEKTASKKIFWR